MTTQTLEAQRVEDQRFSLVQALPWWGQCAVLWLAVLVVLSTVGLLTARVAGVEGGWTPGMRVPGDSIPGIWARFDSGWYIALAAEGYEARPVASGFFPLYIMLMEFIARATGWSYALAGMLIAQLSYLGSILAFYKLARLVKDEHTFAMRSVLYMLLFPTSFFFFAIYAESLYLFLGITGIYYVLRARPDYLKGGLALALASLARPVGFLLHGIVAVEFLIRRDFKRAAIAAVFACLALTFVAVMSYIVYLQSVTGSLTAITDTQAEGWLHVWKFPLVPVVEAFAFIVDNSQFPDWFSYAINLMDLAFTLFGLAMMAVALRWSFKGEFHWSLSLYMLGYLMFVLSRRGPWVPLDEMARWVAPLFPIYLVMARLTLKRPRFHWLVTGVMAVALIGLTAWWISGRWVG